MSFLGHIRPRRPPRHVGPDFGLFGRGLKYLDGILALTAPSVISYLRLAPHRWSAANLGFRDRHARLPRHGQGHRRHRPAIQYRMAAVSGPGRALSMRAVRGSRMDSPPTPTEEDLSLLSPEALPGAASSASRGRCLAKGPYLSLSLVPSPEIAHVAEMDIAAQVRRL